MLRTRQTSAPDRIWIRRYGVATDIRAQRSLYCSRGLSRSHRDGSEPDRVRCARCRLHATNRVRTRIAQRDGSGGRLGVAAQDGHEQLVVPLALPTESMPQASLKSEAALLVDPLGARIEVVDPKAHSV